MCHCSTSWEWGSTIRYLPGAFTNEWIIFELSFIKILFKFKSLFYLKICTSIWLCVRLLPLTNDYNGSWPFQVTSPYKNLVCVHSHKWGLCFLKGSGHWRNAKHSYFPVRFILKSFMFILFGLLTQLDTDLSWKNVNFTIECKIFLDHNNNSSSAWRPYRWSCVLCLRLTWCHRWTRVTPV